VYYLELGGEASDTSLALAEAEQAAASGITRFAPGLATAHVIRPERISMLAYTRAASTVVGCTEVDEAALSELVQSASFSRSGTVAVRARNVRNTADISTQSIERAVGAELVAQGFDIDLESPKHELRVCCSEDTAIVGWTVATRRGGFGGRAPTRRPFFQPGSMSPVDARAYVNIAAGRQLPGGTVVDPMCGTGGLLIEAGLCGAECIGIDVQTKMSTGAAKNLNRYLPDSQWSVLQADIHRVPLRAKSADAIVFDAPYGRQSKVAGDSVETLLSSALHAARRIGPRCVFIADDRYEALVETAGWRLDEHFSRRVHRSLTRVIHVLT
jgi:N2-methylguanosine tRNA methyltransferase (EC 2.1.1.-)